MKARGQTKPKSNENHRKSFEILGTPRKRGRGAGGHTQKDARAQAQAHAQAFTAHARTSAGTDTRKCAHADSRAHRSRADSYDSLNFVEILAFLKIVLGVLLGFY